MTLIKSVNLFLFLSFLAGWATRVFLIRWWGRELVYGPFKKVMDARKLWAVVLVIIGIFASSSVLGIGDLSRIAMIIFVFTLFFIGLIVVKIFI